MKINFEIDVSDILEDFYSEGDNVKDTLRNEIYDKVKQIVVRRLSEEIVKSEISSSIKKEVVKETQSMLTEIEKGIPDKLNDSILEIISNKIWNSFKEDITFKIVNMLTRSNSFFKAIIKELKENL
jgi:hypothetical protein